MRFWNSVELVVGALVIAVAVALVFQPHPHVAIPVQPTIAPATLSVISADATLSERIASLLSEASTTQVTETPLATSTPAQAPLPGPIEPPSTATSTPTTPLKPASTSKTASSTPAVPSTPLVSTQLESALVNIICIPRESSLSSASGSGVIVSPSGVILTAAHVAQYFLLTDFPNPGDITCIIRTGSPAKNAYTAKLIYIPSPWIRANPDTLVTRDPKGSGENDFALLVITGSADSAALPSHFPYVPLSSVDPETGEAVVIGSYAAQTLTNAQIRSSLYPTIVDTSVKERFTFGTNTIDLLSLGGSAAAQEGSSGGGAVNLAGQLIGTITTSSTDGPFATRDLHVITPGHMRRSFAADLGGDFDSYLATSDPTTLVEAFSTRAATLARIVENAIRSVS